ncbi:hypothetical protein [Pseudomonas putida]|uniref:hypothetical protein n=1 Tax=Pseudomonas putida TaxID=303 RepID=UPI002756E3E1|nr:hypothetical protein [Pseudomonas putida]MDP9523605.1 hypothetical protein [Pseudomonas putida]
MKPDKLLVIRDNIHATGSLRDRCIFELFMSGLSHGEIASARAPNYTDKFKKLKMIGSETQVIISPEAKFLIRAYVRDNKITPGEYLFKKSATAPLSILDIYFLWREWLCEICIYDFQITPERIEQIVRLYRASQKV